METEENEMNRIMQELESLRSEIRRQRELLEQQKPLSRPPESPHPPRVTTRRRLLGKLAALGLGGAAALGAGLALPSAAEANLILNRSDITHIGALAVPRGATATSYNSDLYFGLIGVNTTTNMFPFTLHNNSGVGGLSLNSTGIGVVGLATDVDYMSTGIQTGTRRGVVGIGKGTNAIGTVGYGYGTTTIGIYGKTTDFTNGKAALFDGNVQINGTMSATAKSFMIDHPLDPANQYLYHSCIESSELKTFYDGIVTLDAHGEAEVNLPAWFEALNKDLRYQLTCIGQSAPVYIAQTVQQAKFKIAGGQPKQQVCWQITGTRRDAYADKHPLQVEVAKSEAERGKYLYPELFGASEALRIGGEEKLEVKSGK